VAKARSQHSTRPAAQEVSANEPSKKVLLRASQSLAKAPQNSILMPFSKEGKPHIAAMPSALSSADVASEGCSSPTEERIVSEEQELLKRMRDERVDVGLSLIPLTPERKRSAPGPDSSDAPHARPATSSQPHRSGSSSNTLSEAELRSRLAFLKRVSVFRGWEDAMLTELASAMSSKMYGPHQTIVRQDGHSEAVRAC
jgi:hypothetical protein